MDILYPVCCGVDVHKTFLIATIITTKDGSLLPQYTQKRFSTFNSSLKKFAAWLIEHDCFHVCMESTGKYWTPVFNILEQQSIHTIIANPKWVRSVQGNKDDKKDSKRIAELFRLGMVPASFIPDKDTRILREYTRYISKLIAARSSEKNRLQNAFTVCNVALDSVVSDMFGKSATAITDYLVSDDTFSPEHCISLLQGSLKKKADLVLESILGYDIEDVQKTRIILIRRHIDFINTLIDTLESNIDSMVVQYEEHIRRLCTVPGIKRTSAIKIISEIGVDMSQFASSRRLCSWAGLSPRRDESAGKKHSVHISRAGVYLKPALVQVALAAVKDKENPYYAKKYERISKRRGKKRAIIAIARMILTAVYAILSTGQVWHPTDLDRIKSLEQHQLEKQTLQAIRFLESQGFSVG